MLPGDEQDIAEALTYNVESLSGDLFDLESHAKNGIFSGESAVGAGVNTLIGEIERGKHAHRAAELAPRDGSGFAGQQLEFRIRTWREERIELLQDWRPGSNSVG